jgi:hypothetical protein
MKDVGRVLSALSVGMVRGGDMMPYCAAMRATELADVAGHEADAWLTYEALLRCGWPSGGAGMH